ncbi:RagB/SusD family nutrient uptake outer membrane protein [Muricauda sp. SCSIO 64092]|uniref:RagB/SusD family nutrient uptake outer membrane protein n=1 Tax=Allomuricauda sp. SCSIO 64092 TaxID=2908842 RepID=UPI001FF1DDC4|nr:RagB/SusD family nutrient uptake outer membrane protein [Muricauda sp. SCSIO 64092]UOY05122.1 RagB/SusD family nutrient uptake outer membrane protein [Muricauda sp. SCSIO 64092]
MKKKFVYLFAILFGAISCGDEFATTPAVGALSEESLANTQGVDLLLTGAYSMLDGWRDNNKGNQFSVGGDNWWFDVIADDAHKGSTDGDQIELFQIETNDWQTANDYFRGKFTALYAGVNRANAALSVIRGIDREALLPNELEALVGQEAEAHFLRGHYYFELTKIYGNVAIITVENYELQEFNQPNPGPAWEQIEADFQFAIDNLPATRADQPDPGRPTQVVARAYMGKAHLYQSDWAAALAEFNAVITSNEFSLNPEYLDNFNVAGENGPESVFAIQFAEDGGQSFNGNRGGTLNFPAGGAFTCCGFYQPTIDLANAFRVDANGLPLFDSYNDTDFLNDYGINSDEVFIPDVITPVDPRLDYTVGRRGIDFNGFGEHIGKDWIRANFNDISGPYLPKKNVYQAAEFSEDTGSGAWGQVHSGINYNIIRYADVLLMAAEAAVETGDLGTALNYVNQVRNRAANTSVVQAIDESGPAANYQVGLYAVFPDAGFARDAVRFERRVELAMEGHRLFDLRRWGIAQATLTEYYANEARTIGNFGSKVGAYQPHFDLLPIPLTSIDLSNGVLTQNIGY